MITTNSLASAVGSGVKNVTFQNTAEVLPHKIVIIGTYDPAKTSIAPNIPVLVTSAADVGDKFGFGTMVHRLALKSQVGAQGIETWIQPQEETAGAVASFGEIDFAGSTGVIAGTLFVYLAGEQVKVAITDAMTVEGIADATVAAINADIDLPVTAAKTAVTFEVVITAKSKGTWGDDIDISLNLGVGETLPTGVTAAITGMASGSGLPDISTALNGLGTGDNANEAGFTEMIHGYGQDSSTLNYISNYVGEGNDFTGLYDKTVARPFRSLVGDVGAGASGLAAIIAVADLRLDDRSQGVVCVPGSKSHPAEIAAQAVGHMARVNNNLAEEAYNNISLIGVHVGAKADRWTALYSSRDTAVKSGVSPTIVEGGAVKLQNVVSFYRPASVPVSSNAYREMVNISKLQNILNSQKVSFQREKWQNISIVQDTARVTNPTSRLKARDVNSVLDDLVQLVNSWAANAWIADAEYSISLLRKGGYVTVRDGGDGFIITIPVILSGIGNIYDVVTQVDISFAVLQ